MQLINPYVFLPHLTQVDYDYTYSSGLESDLEHVTSYQSFASDTKSVLSDLPTFNQTLQDIAAESQLYQPEFEVAGQVILASDLILSLVQNGVHLQDTIVLAPGSYHKHQVEEALNDTQVFVPNASPETVSNQVSWELVLKYTRKSTFRNKTVVERFPLNVRRLAPMDRLEKEKNSILSSSVWDSKAEIYMSLDSDTVFFDDELKMSVRVAKLNPYVRLHTVEVNLVEETAQKTSTKVRIHSDFCSKEITDAQKIAHKTEVAEIESSHRYSVSFLDTCYKEGNLLDYNTQSSIMEYSMPLTSYRGKLNPTTSTNHPSEVTHSVDMKMRFSCLDFDNEDDSVKRRYFDVSFTTPLQLYYAEGDIELPEVETESSRPCSASSFRPPRCAVPNPHSQRMMAIM